MTTKLKVKARKAWSVPERHLARAAIDFALGELDLGISPVPITVYLKGKHETDFGDSVDLGHKVVIRINKTKNWLQTLFHEMEHARQYIYCELELETTTLYGVERFLLETQKTMRSIGTLHGRWLQGKKKKNYLQLSKKIS